MIAMKNDDSKIQKRNIIHHTNLLPSFKMNLVVKIFRIMVVVGFMVELQANTPSYEPTIPSTEPTEFVPTYIPSSNPSYLPTSAAPSIEAGLSTARPTLTAFPTTKPSLWPTVEAGAPTNAPTIPVVTYIEANQVKKSTQHSISHHITSPTSNSMPLEHQTTLTMISDLHHPPTNEYPRYSLV